MTEGLIKGGAAGSAGSPPSSFLSGDRLTSWGAESVPLLRNNRIATCRTAYKTPRLSDSVKIQNCRVEKYRQIDAKSLIFNMHTMIRRAKYVHRWNVSTEPWLTCLFTSSSCLTVQDDNCRPERHHKTSIAWGPLTTFSSAPLANYVAIECVIVAAYASHNSAG